MFKVSRKTLINLVLIAFAVILISNSLSCFKNLTQKTFKPHLSFISLLKREIAGIIFYHRNMSQLEKIKIENGLLRWKLFDFREVNQENIRLQKILDFKQSSPLRLIPARVNGRSVDSWTSNIIIDKGKDSRIKIGMAVVGPKGLVGRVVEAGDNSSKVSLINDPSQGISSIVQRSRQQGLVSGTLGGNLIMRYLPEDAQIVPGDIVVTSKLSQIYPKGLLIGQVINVGSDFSGLNKYAIVRPSADLASIEEVLVIIP